MIEVFTRRGCTRCDELKEALSTGRIEYVERVIDSDVTPDEVRKRFPGVNSLPILAVGKHVLGGAEELQTLVDRNQLFLLL